MRMRPPRGKWRHAFLGDAVDEVRDSSEHGLKHGCHIEALTKAHILQNRVDGGNDLGDTVTKRLSPAVAHTLEL